MWVTPFSQTCKKCEFLGCQNLFHWIIIQSFVGFFLREQYRKKITSFNILCKREQRIHYASVAERCHLSGCLSHLGVWTLEAQVKRSRVAANKRKNSSWKSSPRLLEGGGQVWHLETSTFWGTWRCWIISPILCYLIEHWREIYFCDVIHDVWIIIW